MEAEYEAKNNTEQVDDATDGPGPVVETVIVETVMDGDETDAAEESRHSANDEAHSAVTDEQVR